MYNIDVKRDVNIHSSKPATIHASDKDCLTLVFVSAGGSVSGSCLGPNKPAVLL